jgi:hypothetical protein
MNFAYRVTHSGLCILLVVSTVSVAAQNSADKGQPFSKREILILLSHEWIEKPFQSIGTPTGAAFVCAVVSQKGAYHLERKIPAIVTGKYDEGVYEGTIADTDLKTLLRVIDDGDVKSAGPSSRNSLDIWQFFIARGHGFQRIQTSSHSSKGLEALKTFLRQLDKQNIHPLKDVAPSNCNLGGSSS